jgi:hypothetical protein
MDLVGVDVSWYREMGENDLSWLHLSCFKIFLKEKEVFYFVINY